MRNLRCGGMLPRTMRRPSLLPLLCLAFVGVCGAAEMDDNSRREVDQLLGRVAQSGCEFYRSGSWYSAGQARDHLERKYRYLAVRNMLGSAEDFVMMAATRSSMSNEAYAIRCRGAAAQPSAAWLTEELKTLRQQQAPAQASSKIAPAPR